MKNLEHLRAKQRPSSQLPPLSAKIEGMAASIAVLADKVSSEEWEFLRILRTNLYAISEQVSALETTLELPDVSR